MKPQDILQWAPLFEPIINAIALLVGGLWIYSRFITKRESEPGGELNVEVQFAGTQDNQWLIEISATLTNKSLVRHNYENFQITARYLLPEDKVTDGPKAINYQLYFPNTIDRRIEGNKRFFANAVYINPGLTFRHSYITAIPTKATFVWVLCKFNFRTKAGLEKTNTQRLFKVPEAKSKL